MVAVRFAATAATQAQSTRSATPQTPLCTQYLMRPKRVGHLIENVVLKRSFLYLSGRPDSLFQSVCLSLPLSFSLILFFALFPHFLARSQNTQPAPIQPKACQAVDKQQFITRCFFNRLWMQSVYVSTNTGSNRDLSGRSGPPFSAPVCVCVCFQSVYACLHLCVAECGLNC